MDKEVRKKLEAIKTLSEEVLVLLGEDEPVSEDIIVVNGKEYNLTKMTVKEIKKLAKDEFGIGFDSSKKEAIIKDFVEYLGSLEVEVEYDEIDTEDEIEVEDEIDTEDEEISIAEKYGLDELSVEELKEILEEAELSIKGKKQTLIDRIVEAIVDGDLELSDEDDSEVEIDEIEIDDSEIVEDDRDEEVVKAEEAVEKKLNKQFKEGKLKITQIKKFLKKYYDGNDDCSDCSKCSKEEQLKCYIDIHKNLVDDDAVYNNFEEPYERNGQNYCCGVPLDEMSKGTLYCTICGTEYEED